MSKQKKSTTKQKKPMTKKKKLILIFSIIGAVIIAATVLIILLSKKKPEETTPSVQCVAPEITVADDGIYWASVANAQSYYYNYNNGEWTEAKDVIAFPTSVGDYTLQLKAVDGEGKDGKITEFAFKVAQMTVECERVDNALYFTGERVFFSVNGMEEGALGVNNILDFSNDTFGTKYTIAYYAKGEFFSQEDNTYYLDSAKQTQELITTQMLSMPVLRANEAGTHLVWTVSENAQNYAVSVDGAKTSVSKDNASVAFPMTEGEHVITVQAVGDGETWCSSLVAEYEMTTKRESVPAITYDKKTNTIAWPEKYDGKMQSSLNGNDYVALNQTTVTAQDGLSLKVAPYYAENEKTYYLASKPISFQTRDITTPKFYMDGRVTWNEDDEAYAEQYYVSVVEEAATPDYDLAGNNVRNVSTLSAGKYTFTVYAADYVEEKAEEVVFYLPSEAKSINFSVLAKPTLSFETGKLLWEVDPLATAYEYRKDGGEWETATENGVLRTRDMATYEVRAIGSQEVGSYALTSNISALLFDPNLETTILGVHDLALFDNAQYADTVASATSGNATKTGIVKILSSLEDATDETEKAILAGANGGVVKVTAGNASPRVQAHWGNADGVQFTLFQPLAFAKNTKLVFRVYVVPNAARQTAFVYNYSGEYVNAKGRTIDAKGNTYAFFDEENNFVGYQSTTNTLIDGVGTQIGTINTTTLTATVTATGTITKARSVYGILDNSDNLLGVADENGVVKNDETVVGTLNANGELIVNDTLLSTSAVRKTNNLEGHFYFGASGLNTAGTSTRTQETYFKNSTDNAVAVGEWVEVSVALGANYTDLLSNIQTVYMHFGANGKAGDTFYIDEIRYEEIPPLVVPEYLKENGDEGALTYEVGGPSWIKPVMTEGTDSVGKYMEYSWSGKTEWGVDALTFKFHGLTLNAGDKVYLHTYTHQGGRWPEIWVDGTKTAFLTREQTETTLAFTATETTELNTLTIRPQHYGNGYQFSIRIYGVYVVRAE